MPARPCTTPNTALSLEEEEDDDEEEEEEESEEWADPTCHEARRFSLPMFIGVLFRRDLAGSSSKQKRDKQTGTRERR